MGTCASRDPVNLLIESKLRDASAKEMKKTKLLLLGSGSSGKSTIYRQLVRIHGEGFPQAQYSAMTLIIQNNCISSIVTLLKQTWLLHNKRPEAYKDSYIDLKLAENAHISPLVQIVMKSKDLPRLLYAEQKCEHSMEELAEAITSLWALPQVKLTYQRRFHNFAIADNMEYFLDKAEHVLSFDYVPSEEDIIHARARTSGVLDGTFEIEGNLFNVFDVGGQRNERRKWIHAFSNADAILYVAALSHFNAVLYEDETLNAMMESLTLFGAVVNSKWFRNTEIILFLNKADLFADSIRNGSSLSELFNSETLSQTDSPHLPLWQPNINPEHIEFDPENTEPKHLEEACNSAIDFIDKIYQIFDKSPRREFYVHVTTATDKKNVEKVFWDVQATAVSMGLNKHGAII